MGLQRSTTEIGELELGVQKSQNQNNGNKTKYSGMRELNQLEIATGR
jgi:hypothetical protein